MEGLFHPQSLRLAHRFFPALLGLFIGMSGALGQTASESPEDASVTLTADFVDRLLVEAQAHSPSLAASRARADAAASAVGSVRTWEDPLFMVGLSIPTARGFKSSEEGDVLYGVQQKLPLFNRPKLARDAAEAEAAKEKLNVVFATEKLRRDLLVALADLGLADTTITFVEQDIDWLEATLATVNQRYRVGKATQVEWLKIQTERLKILDGLKTLKLEREHRQVEVNRLLNRELHADWPRVILPSNQPAIAYNEQLIKAAGATEPKSKVLQQSVAQAEALARITREQRRPEVGIGLQGRNYSGDAGLRDAELTVNFTLPWLNDQHYKSDYQRERDRVRASQQDVVDYNLTVRESLHHLVVDLDAARRQTALYRDELIPLTEQTLASSNTAWANNLGLLQDILDAHRLLIENQLTLAQSLAMTVRDLADISLLTGVHDLSAFASNDNPMGPVMPMPAPATVEGSK